MNSVIGKHANIWTPEAKDSISKQVKLNKILYTLTRRLFIV